MYFETFYPLVDTIGSRNIRCHRSFIAAVESIKNGRPDVWREVKEVVSNSNSSYSEYVVYPNLVENNLAQSTPLKDEVGTHLKLKHVNDAGASIDNDLKFTYQTLFVVFIK